MTIAWRGTLLAGSAAVLTLVGCSSGDDPAGCAEVIEVINRGSDAISDAAIDPSTAGEEVRGLASDLRAAAEGADDEVGDAADALATEYDDIADSIESGVTPDLAQVGGAASAIIATCS